MALLKLLNSIEDISMKKINKRKLFDGLTNRFSGVFQFVCFTIILVGFFIFLYFFAIGVDVIFDFIFKHRR